MRGKISIITLFIFVCAGSLSAAFQLPKWFSLNKKDSLAEWEEKIFHNRVLYSIETRKDGGFLSAKSESSASGLIHRIKFNPKKYPMMSWKWKVIGFPDKNAQQKNIDGSWVEKDDYAARVYVIFNNWNFMNIKTLEYVWDESKPEGTILTSPYFHNIKLFVIETGKKNLGQWVFEERNIFEDYQKAFGKPPSYFVGAIALMTDSDNTASTAETEYKDIRIGYVQ